MAASDDDSPERPHTPEERLSGSEIRFRPMIPVMPSGSALCDRSLRPTNNSKRTFC